LQFQKAIVLCYNRQKIIVDFFPLLVIRVLDQFYDHWLFSDALNSSFDSFMEEDLGIAC
jgi:hypothetical protein